MHFDHYRLCVKMAQRTCQIIDNDVFIFLELRYLLRSLCLPDTCNSGCCFCHPLSLWEDKGVLSLQSLLNVVVGRCLTWRGPPYLVRGSTLPLAHPLSFFNSGLHRFSVGSIALEVLSGRKMAGTSDGNGNSRVGGVWVIEGSGTTRACCGMELEVGKGASTVQVS